MRGLKGNSSGAAGEMVPTLGGCQIQGEGPWTMSPQRGSNTRALLLRQIWIPSGARMENNWLCNLRCAIFVAPFRRIKNPPIQNARRVSGIYRYAMILLWPLWYRVAPSTHHCIYEHVPPMVSCCPKCQPLHPTMSPQMGPYVIMLPQIPTPI